MNTTVKISYSESNPSINDRIKSSVVKKKLINKYIKEGKDLKQLNDKGVKFKMPL